MSRKLIVRGFLIAMAAAGIIARNSSAQDADATTAKYQAVPGTFVGAAGDCGATPAGSKIVTSLWAGGLGLPDDGTSHPSGGKNKHEGLLLNKNGPTPNCSEAFAEIVGWVPGTPLDALGMDYRLGGHCGAGAPRLTAVVGASQYWFGCVHGDLSPAPQDPANWARRTFTGLTGSPSLYPGSEGFVWGMPVDAIFIEFDEGTDTPSPDGNAPAGVGLATVDNIRINNTVITQKKGNPILP